MARKPKYNDLPIVPFVDSDEEVFWGPVTAFERLRLKECNERRKNLNIQSPACKRQSSSDDTDESDDTEQSDQDTLSEIRSRIKTRRSLPAKLSRSKLYDPNTSLVTVDTSIRSNSKNIDEEASIYSDISSTVFDFDESITKRNNDSYSQPETDDHQISPGKVSAENNEDQHISIRVTYEDSYSENEGVFSPDGSSKIVKTLESKTTPKQNVDDETCNSYFSSTNDKSNTNQMDRGNSVSELDESVEDLGQTCDAQGFLEQSVVNTSSSNETFERGLNRIEIIKYLSILDVEDDNSSYQTLSPGSERNFENVEDSNFSPELIPLKVHNNVNEINSTMSVKEGSYLDCDSSMYVNVSLANHDVNTNDETIFDIEDDSIQNLETSTIDSDRSETINSSFTSSINNSIHYNDLRGNKVIIIKQQDFDENNSNTEEDTFIGNTVNYSFNASENEFGEKSNLNIKVDIQSSVQHLDTNCLQYSTTKYSNVSFTPRKRAIKENRNVDQSLSYRGAETYKENVEENLEEKNSILENSELCLSSSDNFNNGEELMDTKNFDDFKNLSIQDLENNVLSDLSSVGGINKEAVYEERNPLQQATDVSLSNEGDQFKLYKSVDNSTKQPECEDVAIDLYMDENESELYKDIIENCTRRSNVSSLLNKSTCNLDKSNFQYVNENTHSPSIGRPEDLVNDNNYHHNKSTGFNNYSFISEDGDINIQQGESLHQFKNVNILNSGHKSENTPTLCSCIEEENNCDHNKSENHDNCVIYSEAMINVENNFDKIQFTSNTEIDNVLYESESSENEDEYGKSINIAFEQGNEKTIDVDFCMTQEPNASIINIDASEKKRCSGKPVGKINKSGFLTLLESQESSLKSMEVTDLEIESENQVILVEGINEMESTKNLDVILSNSSENQSKCSSSILESSSYPYQLKNMNKDKDLFPLKNDSLDETASSLHLSVLESSTKPFYLENNARNSSVFKNKTLDETASSLYLSVLESSTKSFSLKNTKNAEVMSELRNDVLDETASSLHLSVLESSTKPFSLKKNIKNAEDITELRNDTLHGTASSLHLSVLESSTIPFSLKNAEDMSELSNDTLDETASSLHLSVLESSTKPFSLENNAKDSSIFKSKTLDETASSLHLSVLESSTKPLDETASSLHLSVLESSTKPFSLENNAKKSSIFKSKTLDETASSLHLSVLESSTKPLDETASSLHLSVLESSTKPFSLDNNAKDSSIFKSKTLDETASSLHLSVLESSTKPFSLENNAKDSSIFKSKTLDETASSLHLSVLESSTKPFSLKNTKNAEDMSELKNDTLHETESSLHLSVLESLSKPYYFEEPDDAKDLSGFIKNTIDETDATHSRSFEPIECLINSIQKYNISIPADNGSLEICENKLSHLSFTKKRNLSPMKRNSGRLSHVAKQPGTISDLETQKSTEQNAFTNITKESEYQSIHIVGSKSLEDSLCSSPLYKKKCSGLCISPASYLSKSSEECSVCSSADENVNTIPEGTAIIKTVNINTEIIECVNGDSVVYSCLSPAKDETSYQVDTGIEVEPCLRQLSSGAIKRNSDKISQDSKQSGFISVLESHESSFKSTCTNLSEELDDQPNLEINKSSVSKFLNDSLCNSPLYKKKCSGLFVSPASYSPVSSEECSIHADENLNNEPEETAVNSGENINTEIVECVIGNAQEFGSVSSPAKNETNISIKDESCETQVNSGAIVRNSNRISQDSKQSGFVSALESHESSFKSSCTNMDDQPNHIQDINESSSAASYLPLSSSESSIYGSALENINRISGDSKNSSEYSSAPAFSIRDSDSIATNEPNKSDSNIKDGTRVSEESKSTFDTALGSLESSFRNTSTSFFEPMDVSYGNIENGLSRYRDAAIIDATIISDVVFDESTELSDLDESFNKNTQPCFKPESKEISSSKMPVFNKPSENLLKNKTQTLLRPPKFNFQPTGMLAQTKFNKGEKLKTQSAKKSDLENKIPVPNTKSSFTSKLNSPASHSTETKIPRFPSSLKRSVLTPRSETTVSTTSSQKKRYCNIKSPIRTYIQTASPVLVTKVKGTQKELSMSGVKKAVSSEKNKIVNSHLPTIIKKPNVVQKLNYGNDAVREETENIDPNHFRLSLLPVSYKSAPNVFMKDNRVMQKKLPKLNEKFKKLLDTPKPKVIKHEGRAIVPPIEPGSLLSIPRSTSATLDAADSFNARFPSQNIQGDISICATKTLFKTNTLAK